MKCKLLRPMPCLNGKYSYEERKLAKRAGRTYLVKQYIEAPVGTEITGPQCWRLVKAGVAEPADEECKVAAGDSADRLPELATKYSKMDKGMGTGMAMFDANKTDDDDADLALEAKD